MSCQINCLVVVAIISFCTVGAVMGDTDYGSLERIADQIVTKMPSTWQVVEEKSGVIPYGHYDGLKYDGPKGVMLVMVGPQDMFFQWKDKSDIWRQESFHKEAIEIWLMPPEYHLSWKRFFIMKSPVPADRVFYGDAVKVYGMPSRRPTSQHHEQLFNEWFKAVLSQATTLGPKFSPLSWATWKEDIKQVIHDME